MGLSQPCSYPSEYQGPLAIEAQIEIIAETFCLNPRPALAIVNRPMHVPARAEGLFAIPRFDKVAQDYEGAVRCAQSKIEHVPGLRIGSRDFVVQHLERGSRNALAYLTFVDRYCDSDILLVPAQFGRLHAGKPVEFVRRAADSSRIEFGLGTFEVLCMLRTHPHRLSSNRALAIDVPGDLYFPFNRRPAHHAPVVDRSGNRIVIASALISAVDPNCGSVTGFLE